mmetsp:Transcript_104031/g.269298  ORF Transcript_104031/g.269298 Transcript_104031/m.269298 type:complete len:163 (+) Transcript_104031:103-591(+)
MWRPCCWVVWAFVLTILFAAAGARDTTATAAASGAADVTEVLNKSVEATEKLRDSVTRVVNKSAEEVMSIKSLLTTNAKATKALNDLTLEMASLTARMQKFGSAMESCRQELHTLEENDSKVLTPAEVDEPMLGAAALLQLEQHANSLRQQVSFITKARFAM